MNAIEIDALARRADIVKLIGSDIPLRFSGRTYKALCPFHTEKTPSFVVNPERQSFYCFGCGEGGDAISWLVKRHHVCLQEAVMMLKAFQRIGVLVNTGEAP